MSDGRQGPIKLSNSGGPTQTPSTRRKRRKSAQGAPEGHPAGTEPAEVDRRRAEMPQRHRAAYDRAMSGRSRKAAVSSFCRMYMGWRNAAREVRHCSDPACPLYPYRPFK